MILNNSGRLRFSGKLLRQALKYAQWSVFETFISVRPSLAVIRKELTALFELLKRNDRMTPFGINIF